MALYKIEKPALLLSKVLKSFRKENWQQFRESFAAKKKSVTVVVVG